MAGTRSGLSSKSRSTSSCRSSTSGCSCNVTGGSDTGTRVIHHHLRTYLYTPTHALRKRTNVHRTSRRNIYCSGSGYTDKKLHDGFMRLQSLVEDKEFAVLIGIRRGYVSGCSLIHRGKECFIRYL